MPKECHSGRTEAVKLEKATLRQIVGKTSKASETKRQEPAVLPAWTAGVRSHTHPACHCPLARLLPGGLQPTGLSHGSAVPRAR